ncbi:MAG: CDP-alcohol phosphatidyltransferase family protein [Deltaproteobacteria bacterium]|nr:CDP-alcohol phosphatidyltransferase family protein [Deltaproteobacteria bacterium]MBI3755284.1 CDP-alcohol phosphatidyltransferase family protein [Deltaproteobacteria bacterium]
MNIPNILTIFRILLVPVFIIFVIQNNLSMALVIFILAGITDGLDGFIARILGHRTVIGAYLDPIADKFLLISAYLSLTIKGMLPGWLSVVVVSRDIIILSGVVILSVMDKRPAIRPSILSKITTVFQITTIVLVLFYAASQNAYFNLLIAITAGLTILSGLAYIYNGVRIMGESHWENPPL